MKSRGSRRTVGATQVLLSVRSTACHLDPVELRFDASIRVVADLVARAHADQRATCRVECRAAQIGGRRRRACLTLVTAPLLRETREELLAIVLRSRRAIALEA